MRRTARIAGTLLIAAGVLVLAWAVTVWRWQDPLTAAVTAWEQHRLERALDAEFRAFRAARSDRRGADLVAARREISADARRFRRQAARGQAIGRISIERIGLSMVLVNGTDHDSLTKGPGRDPRSFMPGENRLVYVAGHRTTYAAPFSRIEAIRPGDAIRLEMPYATFTYRAVRHRVVAATDLSVLRSPRRELLELQACHPRFFASHRYLVYARLVSVAPRGGGAIDVRAAAATASG